MFLFQAGVVTLIKDHSTNNHGLEIVGKRKGGQQVYLGVTHMHPFRSRTKWMLHVDFDEYVYARTKGPYPSESIAGVLEQVAADQSCIMLPWTMCGSNGQASQPEDIIENIVTCQLSHTDRHAKMSNTLLKWVCRGEAIGQYIWIHNILPTKKAKELNPGCGVMLPDGQCMPWVQGFARTIGFRVVNHSLVLNHYQTQSRQAFADEKMVAGSVDTSKNPRNWKYYEARSHHHATNTELRDKRRRSRSADQATVDKIMCVPRHAGGKRPSWCPPRPVGKKT
jgi:hypothetical protein